MDTTIKNFLTILKAALVNEQPRLEGEITPDMWQQLFRMASSHNVLPMFYEAVYALPSLQQANLPYLPMIKRQMMQQVMQQTVRTEEFLKLSRALQAAGVRPLVVKGIICRSLYPKPDCRQSGDEDLLIREEQFAACHQAMLDQGMRTTSGEDKLDSAYEIPYYKPGSTLHIEVHRHLFPPESEAYGDMNRFFRDAFDHAVSHEIRGTGVLTMAHTDHLLYLICHAFKHFLHSGFGIRQVCDIILYANTYGTQIDWIHVLDRCREIRAEKFAAALFRIGENYLVFDPDQAAYPKAWRKIRVNEIPMLEELLSAGVFGSAEKNRVHSSNITLDAVAARKQGRKARNKVLAALFPPVSTLESTYPYLKKHPWLLPVAWMCRMWSYFLKTGHSRNKDAAEALKIGSARIELMKEYGILDR